MSSNFSRIRAENQFVFLNTGLLYGINSLKINENFGNAPVNYIGIGSKFINQSVNQAQYADLSMDSILLDNDIVIQQTGINPFNCFILSNPKVISNALSLTSGYLSHYSAKYSVNQPAQINSTMRFYNGVGNIPISNLNSLSSGQLIAISGNNYPSFNGNIGDTNYITLILNEYQTNRVLDFTFSLDFNRLPIFNIGNRFPKRVELVFPLNVTCDISFEADENFIDVSSIDFPLNKTVQNIELDVYSNRTDNLMGTYQFQNMTLVSNSRDSSVDGNVTISRRYVGQIFSFPSVSGRLPINGIDFGFVAAFPDFYLDFGMVNQIPTGIIDWGYINS